MIRAEGANRVEQEKRLNLQVAKVIAGIINYTFPAPDDLVTAEELLDNDGGASMSRERYKANKARHYDRMRREMATRQREADPTIPDYPDDYFH